jgi:hypothetical protein
VLRENLRTRDGRKLQVLHPGFWNREAGPDFRGAVLKVGDEIKTGDVEIDLAQSGWHGHGHDRNPNFEKVVLHIVWQGADGKSELPVLELKDVLDAPLSELIQWLGTDASKGWPAELSGNCCAPLRELPAEKLQHLLREAASIRLQRKAQEFQFRARQTGWEQSFWEGIFRALGYKQNVWPMQRIGEITAGLQKPESVLQLQARLLGIGGLLPAQLPEKRSATASYLREVWDVWWRERDVYADCILPRAIWKLNALRPANHPERRLALAAHWLVSEKFVPRLERAFASAKTGREFQHRLLELMQVDSDEFWTSHWTFRSARLPRPQPLIGEKRVTDLAMNVVLPWFWMRAVAGKNCEFQQKAEEFYFGWTAAEDNSVLRMARQRLLGTQKASSLPTAATQQGMLQIIRDFCEHSNAICTNCRFPDLVKAFGS